MKTNEKETNDLLVYGVKVNGRELKTNGLFAYDGCHKIYVIEDNEDLREAQEIGYNILPIQDIRKTYYDSCPLKFISNWKLNTRYVGQFENDVKFETEIEM